ncbi:hypothetical protein WJ45_06805 [Burkholderia ubonensis]|nr:hypothetical protein WJ45_06805 [Burkholderia ubonensis]KVQ52920.1 hypothetical protein WK04_03795 [Burkholderia ubonensis]
MFELPELALLLSPVVKKSFFQSYRILKQVEKRCANVLARTYEILRRTRIVFTPDTRYELGKLRKKLAGRQRTIVVFCLIKVPGTRFRIFLRVATYVTTFVSTSPESHHFNIVSLLLKLADAFLDKSFPLALMHQQ